jgi:hypothetical protein
MSATTARFANRCLPLLMANQSGWLVLNGVPMRAEWDGSDGPAGLTVAYEQRPPSCHAVSHFGHGIVTWNLPYLFRTPPGYDLLVRGPANTVKDGVCPLEGLVETDWSPATFTVNWKLTRPGTVAFAAGEPLGMLVPQRRAELEEFRAEIRPIGSAPEVHASHRAWVADRARFLRELTVPGSAAARRGWQRDYFRGRAPDGPAAPAHRTNVRLRGFDRF